MKSDKPDLSDSDELTQLVREGSALPTLSFERVAGLRDRLLERTGQMLAAETGLCTVRQRHARWTPVAPGVQTTTLWQGPQGRSILIRLAQGAALPQHRHQWLEEGIVLAGSVQFDGLTLAPGDYHVAEPGSLHGPMTSPHGALGFLRGVALVADPPTVNAVHGRPLDDNSAQTRTVHAHALQWRSLAPGVMCAELWSDPKLVCHMYRLEPGAEVPAHEHSEDEECLLVSGELMLGDTLLQAGDYQIAARGSRHGTASTDVGAVLFVRGQKANRLEPWTEIVIRG